MRRAALAAALAASAALVVAGVAIALAPGETGPATPRLGLPENFGVIVNTPSREASVLDADSHFERHPGMLGAYNDLFAEVRGALAESHPGVMVGNAVSLDRIINRGNEAFVDGLAAGDFVAFTYRPVNLLNEVSRTPQGAMADMAEMLRIAGGRQVALLEAGWTSAGDVGGDEEAQAEFAAALAGLAASEPRIEFATWYRMHDREAGTCEVAAADAGGSLLATDDGEYAASALGSYVCGAGLLRADGSPKPAWEALASR